jgi:predicted permease
VIGVLTGFAIITTMILVGWVLGRVGVLGDRAEFVLGRLAFFALTPALLITVLAQADPRTLFSELVPVTAIAAVTTYATAVLVARLIWRRPVPETTVVALASGSVNASNFGLPIALYVLGDAALAAPVILLNLMVFAPIALAVLDWTTGEKTSLGRILARPLRNPLIIASAIGLVISGFQLEVPAIVFEPVRIIGGAAVPAVLIMFGISLHGARVLAATTARRDIVLALVLKLISMPLVAWLAGTFVFGLDDDAIFAVVVLAALPAAQHVYTWAHVYGRHVTVARDAVILSTLGALPVLVLIAAALAPR